MRELVRYKVLRTGHEKRVRRGKYFSVVHGRRGHVLHSSERESGNYRLIVFVEWKFDTGLLLIELHHLRRFAIGDASDRFRAGINEEPERYVAILVIDTCVLSDHERDKVCRNRNVHTEMRRYGSVCIFDLLDQLAVTDNRFVRCSGQVLFGCCFVTWKIE